MTDVVWSVNILLALGLIGVAIWIYKILLLSYRENVQVQDQERKEGG